MARDLLHRAEAESADASHPFPSPDRFCRPSPSHLRPNSDTIAMSERAKGPQVPSPVSPSLWPLLLSELPFPNPSRENFKRCSSCPAPASRVECVCDCECDLRKLRDGLLPPFLPPLSLSCVFSSSASNRGEERRRHFTLHYFST